MTTLTKEEIRQKARSGKSIRFLRSSDVAERIAREVGKKLKVQKIGGTEVSVGQSSRYPGALTVQVTHIALRGARGSDTAGPLRQVANNEASAINKILDESYHPSDLLTSWTSPRRRR